MRLTQRCGQRCPLLRVRAVWTRDPETWRSFYTLLCKPDLISLALSCGDRNNSAVCGRGNNVASGAPDAPSAPLTLSRCGCVWWAVGWAAPWAEAASSPSPTPGCPPAGRGTRAAGGSGGRPGAARRVLLLERHRGLTSWLLSLEGGWGGGFLCSRCFQSPPAMHDHVKGRVTPPAWQPICGRAGVGGVGSTWRSRDWQSNTLR